MAGQRGSEGSGLDKGARKIDSGLRKTRRTDLILLFWQY